MSAGGPGGGRGRDKPPRQVKCPQCGQPTPYQGNPWRPFCSERCKLIDLGAWADERYAIPSQDTPGQDDEQ